MSETVPKSSALRGFSNRSMGLLELPRGNLHSRDMEQLYAGVRMGNEILGRRFGSW